MMKNKCTKLLEQRQSTGSMLDGQLLLLKREWRSDTKFAEFIVLTTLGYRPLREQRQGREPFLEQRQGREPLQLREVTLDLQPKEGQHPNPLLISSFAISIERT